MKDLSPSPWEGEPKPLGSRVGQRWAVTFVCFRGCHQVWSILGVDLVFPQGQGVVGESLEGGTVGM